MSCSRRSANDRLWRRADGRTDSNFWHVLKAGKVRVRPARYVGRTSSTAPRSCASLRGRALRGRDEDYHERGRRCSAQARLEPRPRNAGPRSGHALLTPVVSPARLNKKSGSGNGCACSFVNQPLNSSQFSRTARGTLLVGQWIWATLSPVPSSSTTKLLGPVTRSVKVSASPVSLSRPPLPK